MTFYTGILGGGTGVNLFDRDVVLMAAADGTQVLVQNVTPADAPAGTAPTIKAFKLDGSPYTGSLSDLTCCGSPKVNLSKKLYLKENTGILTIQDIILQLPANSLIESISILQDAGVGIIIGDAGSSLTMQTGRVISYSIDDVGNFNKSNLTMDAGTITTATPTNDPIHSTVGGWTGGVGQPLTTNTVYSTQLGIQRITIIYSI
jgi:hypothetical protein